MVRQRLFRAVLLSLVSALVLTACADREGDDIGSAIFNGTTPDGQTVEPPRTTLPLPTVQAVRVPIDAPTIQSAINSAQPGDLILVDPGIYSEEIIIATPDIVLRGRDRNTVFIDGGHTLSTGVRVQADGVAIENLTVRNYLTDGVTVGSGEALPVNRFRAFHLTTSNTGDNGLALRNVTNAEVRQGWHSGHGGAGVLVERCTDCATLITTTLVEYSNVGVRVSGAINGVSVTSATSRNNRVGILVEDGAEQPTVGAVVASNVVLNNGFTSTPTIDQTTDRGFGVGVQLGGSTSTAVVANRILGNLRTGVLLAPNNAGSSGDPIAPNVTRNVVEGHPESDIVLAFEDRIADPSVCVSDNGAATVGPPGAAEAAACSDANTIPPEFTWSAQERESIEYVNGPVPPPIDGMVDADDALPVPAGPVVLPDPAAAQVPSG